MAIEHNQSAERQRYEFSAMACPCETLVDSDDLEQVIHTGRIAQAEAARIEQKYSRYRQDTIVARINAADGHPIEVDAETADLLDYAANCHELSDGLFDITSGVLRRVWRFDGSDRIPSAEAVSALLPLVGWDKVEWRRPYLRMPPGMEIDFGGFGKEYAVDRALLAIRTAQDAPALVNFGGDLRITGSRRDGAPWRVALESIERLNEAAALIELYDGALTTSGDARKFLLKDGRRYSHILDPRSGWPVENPPRSVTVAALTCLEAGLISTLAMLQGDQAEAFLHEAGAKAWCIR